MDEQWRAVVGFEGLYDVSDCGSVRSLPRRVPSKGGSTQLRPRKRLKPGVTTGGYHNVEMLGTTYNVHRLVLRAFVGEPPEGMPVCRHRNGVPTDNRVANLVWGTPLENSADMIAHGRSTTGIKNGKYTKPECTPIGRNHGMAFYTPADFERVLDLRCAGNTYKAIARWTGISLTHVGRIVTGRVNP